MGTIDSPFNPLALALGADASFVARTLDVDPALMRSVLKRANEHQGSSFVEIYQNCNVYNDGAFNLFTDKAVKKENTVELEHGKPLVFGNNKDKGIRLEGTQPEVVSLGDGVSAEDLWIHDEKDYFKATLLSRLYEINKNGTGFPRPLGILYSSERPTYEDLLHQQKDMTTKKSGQRDLMKLFMGSNYWEIQ